VFQKEKGSLFIMNGFAVILFMQTLDL